MFKRKSCGGQTLKNNGGNNSIDSWAPSSGSPEEGGVRLKEQAKKKHTTHHWEQQINPVYIT